jgi:hypothetical protein
MKTATLVAAAFCLGLSGVPALAQPADVGATGPRVVARTLSTPAERVGVVLRCAACDATSTPALALLWQGAGGEAILRTLEATEWGSGTFTFSGAGEEAVTLQGTPVDGGYALDLPLGDAGLPFRSQVVLPGHVGRPGVYWPGTDAVMQLSFVLDPVEAVLDEHPDWDPARSTECDALLPKDAATPFTFFVDGEPRAWLFPSVDPDGAPWTFQFARPGASLLERVSVGLAPSDEGAHWGFRLPLSAVLGPAAEVRVGDAGRLDLAGCPRQIQ